MADAYYRFDIVSVVRVRIAFDDLTTRKEAKSSLHKNVFTFGWGWLEPGDLEKQPEQI